MIIGRPDRSNVTTGTPDECKVSKTPMSAADNSRRGFASIRVSEYMTDRPNPVLGEKLPMTISTRFRIKFDAGYAWLSRVLLISPSDSYVEVAANDVSVRMAWAFRATFARSCVVRTSVTGERVPLTRGVHGWAGRWLVNGAGDGMLAIDLEPRQRAYVMGFPISLQQLLVSVEDPYALATALAPDQR